MSTASARTTPPSMNTSTSLRPARIRLTVERSKIAAPRVVASAANPRQARNGSSAAPRVRIAAPASTAASLVTAAALTQLWSNPAARRASYSLRKRFVDSASRRLIDSRSCGPRSQRMSRRRIAAANSSEDLRMPSHRRRAARRPWAAAVAWNEASKSSRIKPSDPAVDPPPIRSASTTTVLTPAVANAHAQAQPVRPPPTMTTPVSISPRNFGYDGRLLFGNRSSQNAWCRTISLAARGS